MSQEANPSFSADPFQIIRDAEAYVEAFSSYPTLRDKDVVNEASRRVGMLSSVIAIMSDGDTNVAEQVMGLYDPETRQHLQDRLMKSYNDDVEQRLYENPERHNADSSYADSMMEFIAKEMPDRLAAAIESIAFRELSEKIGSAAVVSSEDGMTIEEKLTNPDGLRHSLQRLYGSPCGLFECEQSCSNEKDEIAKTTTVAMILEYEERHFKEERPFADDYTVEENTEFTRETLKTELADMSNIKPKYYLLIDRRARYIFGDQKVESDLEYKELFRAGLHIALEADLG